MLPATDPHQLLAQYTADLPDNLLREVLDYVQFLRLKRLPQVPAEALRTELQLGQRHEWQHLESEFADFEQRFPSDNSATDPKSNPAAAQ